MEIIFWMAIATLDVSLALGTWAFVFNVRLICMRALKRECQMSAVFVCPLLCFIIAGLCFNRCFPGVVIGRYVCVSLIVLDLIVEIVAIIAGRDMQRASPGVVENEKGGTWSANNQRAEAKNE